MSIEAIVGTHVHADHRSGERDLAVMTHAPIYLHRSADVAFPFTPIDEGGVISLGNVLIRVLHTPGHTPESMCLLIVDRTRGEEPWMVLTGDTLLVGDVGRPDLGGESAARELFASLHQKLLTLPDYVAVYPAHFAGSPCGGSLSGKPSSTIGFERRFNQALKFGDAESFSRALYENLPPKPAAFEATIAANRGR